MERVCNVSRQNNAQHSDLEDNQALRLQSNEHTSQCCHQVHEPSDPLCESARLSFQQTIHHHHLAQTDKYTRVLNRELLKLAPENLYYFTHCIKKVIKTCSNSRAFGPDGLCIQFLKNMGPKALSYFAALINHSLNHFRIPAIWNSSVITEEF